MPPSVIPKQHTVQTRCDTSPSSPPSPPPALPVHVIIDPEELPEPEPISRKQVLFSEQLFDEDCSDISGIIAVPESELVATASPDGMRIFRLDVNDDGSTEESYPLHICAEPELDCNTLNLVALGHDVLVSVGGGARKIV